MILATVLALTAAVLHAGWNLAVKQSGDRFVALWGQFVMAGLIGLVVVAAFGRVSAAGWAWAGVSGLAHVPYSLGLARAYRHGDFSLTYPVARGGGAMLAGLAGIALLGDRYSALGIAGFVITGLGLLSLGSIRSPGVGSALVVSASIAVYSVVDAHAIRTTGSPLYAAASHVAVGITVSATGAVRGRGRQMAEALRHRWRRFLVFGAVVGGTYALVQVAFKLAPVGYVTCLRESSVVIAAVVGVKLLGEAGSSAGARRIAASLVVATGLLVLIVGGRA